MHPAKKIGLAAMIAAALAAPFSALADLTGAGLNATAGQALLATTPGQLPIIIGTIIKTALGLVGVIFLVLMVYAGFIWMIARGDEAKVEKAKDTIVNCIIGIVIVVGAYAITSYLVTAFNPPASSGANSCPALACPTGQYCDMRGGGSTGVCTAQ
jgi:uncharacterized BrkB/YihY/UPF0761 family membrane protein